MLLSKTSLPLQAHFSAITRGPSYTLLEWNPLLLKANKLHLTTFKSTLQNANQNSLKKNTTCYGERFVSNLKTSARFQQVVSC